MRGKRKVVVGGGGGERKREMCHIQMVPTCQVVHLNISVQLSLHVYKIALQNQGRVLSFAKLKGWGIRSNCENFNVSHQINIQEVGRKL